MPAPQELSASDRNRLIQTLNGLPSTQLDELIFALNPPPGVLSSKTGTVGDRTLSLLIWAEGPTGCGLSVIVDLLNQSLAQANHPPFKPEQRWRVPFPRNTLFTGRKILLDAISEALKSRKRAAFCGMGGIGKTQTALEYVYRHRNEYDYVFWVRAELQEEIISGYVGIAEALQLPGRQQPDQMAVVNLIKQWLADHDDWLLILDNADEIRLLQGFLPAGDKGHILLTTRAQALGTTAQRVEIAKMAPDEGSLFLLRRAGLVQPDAPLTDAEEADQTLARTLNSEMDGLPLALDQAGAYIEERFLSLEDYLDLFREEKAELLQARGELANDHPSVTVTFSLAFKKVAERSAAAADLLRVCEFLAPDDIPEEIFIAGASELGENLSPIAESKRTLTDAIAEAARYSLIAPNRRTKTLSIHRLVQEVLKSEMDEAEQAEWADRIVRAVNTALPGFDFDFGNLESYVRILPHAQFAVQLIELYSYESEAAGRLLNQMGYYLQVRCGDYSEAEVLFEQALILRRQVLGNEHPDVATSLNNLAMLYYYQGLHEKAEPLLVEALDLACQCLGYEHQDSAQSMNNLALLYRCQGHYREAEPLFLQALELRQKLFGEKHVEVANSIDNIASLRRCQKQFGDAKRLYLQALNLYQELLGSEHPEVATSLKNLGLLYEEKNCYVEAESLYQKALELYRRLLGDEHPDIATSLSNLARVYDSQDRYSEAESFYTQAIQILNQRLGENHPHTQIVQRNFELCLQAALSANQAHTLSNHPLTQQRLADLR